MNGLLLAAMSGCVVSASASISDNPKKLPIPNPYLSYLPVSAEPNYKFWQQKISRSQVLYETSSRKKSGMSSSGPDGIAEQEPNNSYQTAQEITGFGSTGKLENSFRLDARFQVVGGDNKSEVIDTSEDNGDVLKATEIVFSTNTTYNVSSVIGDGAYGAAGLATGDFDFYKLTSLMSGQDLKLDINAQSLSPASSLDSQIYVLNSSNQILAVNDQADGNDSFLEFTVPVDGDYYVVVSGWPSAFLQNAEDSSSGVSSGTEGPYELIISTGAGVEADYFSIEAIEGDVLEVTAGQAAEVIEVFDSSQSLVMSSTMNIAGLLPDKSQLGNLPGNASVIFVAPESGKYYLKAGSSSLTEDSGYTLRAQVKRPALEQGLVPQKQVLFVDFDGATINALNLFEGGKGEAELSPLNAFLENWGLSASEESNVIDAILSVMEEQLKTQLQSSTLSSQVDIEILNSRDHADVFGAEHVSRVIIGGTMNELGMFTIGIAESIDPGNFATEETGVVLLDILSGPKDDPNSINFFEVKSGSSKIDLIGRAVGSIASHEAGHFLSSLHTDNENDAANIMDQGGNFPQLLGLNDSGQYEGGLKPLVQFIADSYSPFEGFKGVENTNKSTAYGLSSVPEEVPSEAVLAVLSGANSGAGGGGGTHFLFFIVFAGFSLLRRPVFKTH